jgi:hypothetical protein
MVTVDSDKLDPVVEWMRSQRVRRLRLPDGLEMELEPGPRAAVVASDERPVPMAPAIEDVDGAGLCACGHSWIEHSESGCFHGCSHEVCTSSATAEPEPSR